MTSDQSGKLRTDTTHLKRENHIENSGATSLDETPVGVCLETYILRHYAEERLKSLGVLQ
jgi:hypothetical protein